MRTVKLMADYFCYPLWDVDEIDNLSPELLPISDALRKDLMLWQRDFDATIDLNDPKDAGFNSEEEVNKFTTTGYELFKRLQDELGPEFIVIHNIMAARKSERSL